MTSIRDQVASYLSDAHAIEEQALAQLRAAPDIAGNNELAVALAAHLTETEGHERLVRERLDELGETPSRLKDILMAAGGKGFVLFARAQPDTPGNRSPRLFPTNISDSPRMSFWPVSLKRRATGTRCGSPSESPPMSSGSG